MDVPDYTDYPIDRPDKPPERRERNFRVFTTPPGEPTILRCLVPEIVLVNTHWLPDLKRTVFCGGPAGDCLLDHKKNKPRAAGYLIVENRSDKNKVMLWHATENVLMECPALSDRGRSLVNARIRTWREGKTNRSPILAAVEYAAWGAADRSYKLDTWHEVFKTYQARNNESRRRIRGEQ